MIKLKLRQKGDTIVEVMISMVVLAIVITVAYATSSRSFQSSVDSQYRDQAVSFAQQQIELLKNADNNGAGVISAYRPATSFCIKPSDSSIQTGSSCNLALGGWGASGDKPFTVNTIYTGDASTKTYKVVVSWTSAENRPQQTIVYYKANDSYVGTPAECPVVGVACASVATNPPLAIVTLSDDSGGATKAFNSIVNLTWTTQFITAGSCTLNQTTRLRPQALSIVHQQPSSPLNVKILVGPIFTAQLP